MASRIADNLTFVKKKRKNTESMARWRVTGRLIPHKGPVTMKTFTRKPTHQSHQPKAGMPNLWWHHKMETISLLLTIYVKYPLEDSHYKLPAMCRALMLSFESWTDSRIVGYLRRHDAHVMSRYSYEKCISDLSIAEQVKPNKYSAERHSHSDQKMPVASDCSKTAQ